MKRISFMWMLVLLLGASLFSFSAIQASAETLPQLDFGVANYRMTVEGRIDSPEELLQARERGFFASNVARAARIEELIAAGVEEPLAFDYVLPRLSETIAEIRRALERPVQNATLRFLPDESVPFAYTHEQSGKKLNEPALYRAVLSALRNGETKIRPEVISVSPAVTEAELRRKTSLRGKFSTDYSSSGAARKHNVQLAMQKLKGLVVLPGERVSFNSVVGARTQANGFRNAKVILNGVYTDGIGGGVCQVSTTLYNACLLANVSVNTVAPHSLQSSYVLPAFDAMVSETTDLAFTNQTGSPLYLVTKCNGATASVYLYGEENPYEIKRVSKVVSREAQGYEERPDTDGAFVTFEDETYVLRPPRDSVLGKAYLQYLKNGRIEKEVCIRTVRYRGEKGVRLHGVQKRTEGSVPEESAA